jgi:hypothetical protein
MEAVSRVILGCSYMVALVLTIAWAIGALSNIDSGASGIVFALAGIVTCGVGIGLLSHRLSAGRRDHAEQSDRGHSFDKLWRN